MKKIYFLFLLLFTSIFFPVINYAQAPVLGTASGFALFTVNGVFDNSSAATTVTGDAGNNIGAFNAFPPGMLIGQRHVADAITAQAAIDVETAYADLVGRTCGSMLDVALGGGQQITPGVYCTGSATTLNGNITLDGQGNPNALFIFQLGGAFTAGIASRVNLINAAKACNVYWQINGGFDLGDQSVFRGTVISDGAINLLGNATLVGRGLTRAGALSLQSNTVLPCDAFTLPITLISFNTEYDSRSAVNLSWQTATEFNTAYFEIEKSADGMNFNTIGKMLASGNSTQAVSYYFTDTDPQGGINYYRLKQVDIDGLFKYSYVKTVRCNLISPSVEFYPNPFSTTLNITCKEASRIINSKLAVYNINGTVVINTIIYKQVTTINTSNLPEGIYYYKITSDGNIIQSGRLVSIR
jgi:hypothetical protein